MICCLVNIHMLIDVCAYQLSWSAQCCLLTSTLVIQYMHNVSCVFTTSCTYRLLATEAIRRLQLRLLTLHLRPIGLRPSGVIFSSGSCEHFFHQYARTYTCPLRLYMLFLIFFRIWIFHQTLSVVICSSGSCEHFYMNTHTHTCMPIQIFWYDITYFWNLYDADIFECTSSCIYVLYERVTE